LRFLAFQLVCVQGSLLTSTVQTVVEELTANAEQETLDALQLGSNYLNAYKNFWKYSLEHSSTEALTERLVKHATEDEVSLIVDAPLEDFKIGQVHKRNIIVDAFLAMKATAAVLYASFASCDTYSYLVPYDEVISAPFKGLYDSGFWCRRLAGGSTPNLNIFYAVWRENRGLNNNRGNRYWGRYILSRK